MNCLGSVGLATPFVAVSSAVATVSVRLRPYEGLGMERGARSTDLMESWDGWAHLQVQATQAVQSRSSAYLWHSRQSLLTLRAKWQSMQASIVNHSTCDWVTASSAVVMSP